MGVAISFISSIIKYFLDFAVAKTSANIFSSSMVVNGTFYSQNQLNNIYKKHNLSITEYFLMLSKLILYNYYFLIWIFILSFSFLVYSVFFCVFCCINLVYILIAKFKSRPNNSNFLTNVFVVYFLIVLFTFFHIPEFYFLLVTIFETLHKPSIVGHNGVIAITKLACIVLRGLTLLFEQLYIFWFNLKQRK